MGKSIYNQTGGRIFEKNYENHYSVVFYDQLQKY